MRLRDLQGRLARRAAARTSPARSRWPASCAPTRACGSASTASSCSAATASSRSTRSSGGTATCVPSASWKGRCWSDDQPRDPQEAPRARRPGPPGRDEHAAADLAQVRPRRARVPQGARHARRDDRRALRVRRDRGRRRHRRTPRRGRRRHGKVKNGANLASVLSVAEMCWGDTGLLLSMPRQGLGNSAIASVADDEQLERFDGHVGRDGDHRARAPARTPPASPPRPSRRRRVRHQRREDLRHLRRARRQRRRVGDPRQGPGPGGDQVVRGRARTTPA